MIKPLTPQFRSDILESLNKQLEELDSCENNSYVALQKKSRKLLNDLLKCLLPYNKRSPHSVLKQQFS